MRAACWWTTTAATSSPSGEGAGGGMNGSVAVADASSGSWDILWRRCLFLTWGSCLPTNRSAPSLSLSQLV